MFTGLIEGRAKVVKLSGKDGGKELVISLPADWRVGIGESVAVDGACLTVTGVSRGEVRFDVSSETLGRTTLGVLRRGANVNVERALKVGDRLGGHFVQGHVDGVGTVSKTVPAGRRAGQHTFWFEVEESLAGMIIEKGSVAIDGISLTVVEVERSSFSVAIIPHTLEVTTLGEKRVGDKVNVEVDLVGKWVKKLLGESGEGVTLEKLREAGFA